MESFDVIIIGGGAAGFFCANLVSESSPEAKILIIEKTGKTLQKVKVSGGGRCNVTNSETKINAFAGHYPRGENFLKKRLLQFGQKEMIQWLKEKGVDLVAEEDGRMFPISNQSQEIIDCFEKVLKNKNCTLLLREELLSFEDVDNGIEIVIPSKRLKTKYLIFAPGSSEGLWKLLETRGVEIQKRVPSLFTFKLKDNPISHLSGISIPDAIVKILGTKLSFSGPLLITHQGLSGPAILKLSALGAITLFEKDYDFDISVNFSNFDSWDQCNLHLRKLERDMKQCKNFPQFGLPSRLWEYVLMVSELDEQKRWIDFSKKDWNKLTENLFQHPLKVQGKNTFKEEFVVAGGVDLSEIESQTCELRKLKNCFAIGEFLNVDGLTGGFNFQNCWTTAFLTANEISNRLNQ